MTEAKILKSAWRVGKCYFTGNILTLGALLPKLRIELGSVEVSGSRKRGIFLQR